MKESNKAIQRPSVNENSIRNIFRVQILASIVPATIPMAPVSETMTVKKYSLRSRMV